MPASCCILRRKTRHKSEIFPGPISHLIFDPKRDMLTPKSFRLGKSCTDFLAFSAQIQNHMASKSAQSSLQSSSSTYWILQSIQVNFDSRISMDTANII